MVKTEPDFESRVSREASDCFMQGRNYTSNNTDVICENGMWKLYLHGTCIAWRRSLLSPVDDPIPEWAFQKFTISVRPQHMTELTKRRLNALPGVFIGKVSGQWYLDWVQWDGREATIMCAKAFNSVDMTQLGLTPEQDSLAIDLLMAGWRWTRPGTMFQLNEETGTTKDWIRFHLPHDLYPGQVTLPSIHTTTPGEARRRLI